eukprot:985297-Pyramimonas_sp.AAC.1
MPVDRRTGARAEAADFLRKPTGEAKTRLDAKIGSYAQPAQTPDHLTPGGTREATSRTLARYGLCL